MSRTKSLLMAVCLCTSWTGMLFAQYHPGDIHVRAATDRPGCNFLEAWVEIYNCGTQSYKVRAERTYTNPSGHTQCTGCQNSPGTDCGVTPNLSVCETTNDTTVTVLPYGSSGGGLSWCTYSADCMGGGPSACPNCDNRVQTGSCNISTCGTQYEFCADYTQMLVTVTAYKASFRDPWVNITPVVVCGLGDGLPEGTGSCQETSYCNGGQRQACVFGPLDPICDLE